MSTIADEIMNKGDQPTREDIARLLASVGAPGKKQDEKTAAVKRLFEDGGFRSASPQGHAVWDNLESYEAY